MTKEEAEKTFEKYDKAFGPYTKEQKKNFIESLINPMSDDEYLTKYQKKYGKLNENEKKIMLDIIHHPMSDDEFIEALKSFE